MKKQIKVSLTISAALLAMAGIAQAAPAELNIYGSSAQYDYWNAQATNYASTILGCTSAVKQTDNTAFGTFKHNMVKATGCSSTLIPVNSVSGTRDLDIRYAAIASAEGILAVKKQAPLDNTLAAGCNVAAGERLMYADSTSLVCKQVHIGPSDVAGESLVQLSSGQLKGPMGGGQFDVTMAGVDTTGLTATNAVVVPFGFFVNAAVTAKTCSSGLVGNYCTANSQCETAYNKADGVCGAAATITNISREEATLIFSQSVSDWSDLGAYFTPQPVVACLRHAGSGTHSALDLTVMNSSWGANIVTAETPDAVWFNQGSGDELACINGSTTAVPAGQLIGAIGYADGDAAIGNAAKKTQNVKQLKYNGFYPTRSAIRNGLYDFYSDGWLYTNPANVAGINNIANSMINYAKIPGNVPAAKANYWATVREMKFNRGTEAGYPAFTGASVPMLP